MNAHRKPPTIVVVTGDVTIDWNIARKPRGPAAAGAWSAADWSRACPQPGGAALLAELVTAAASNVPLAGGRRIAVRAMPRPAAPMHPGATPYHHSYATWTFRDEKASDVGESFPAWRVQEFFGLDPRPAKDVSGAAELRVVDDSPDADLVILDDAGLGFRDTRDLWPAALDAPGRQPHVLMKMARPVAQGPLWKQLLDRHAGRLTIVVPVNDLREMEVQISQGLSWERTAQDLVWELTRNPSINALARCAHVVVLFYAAGALVCRGGHAGSGD